MKIELKNTISLTGSQIQSIEKLSEVVFSSEIKHFYLNFAGVKPEIDNSEVCFKITLNDGYQIEDI